jgi:hypothetical protein
MDVLKYKDRFNSLWPEIVDCQAMIFFRISRVREWARRQEVSCDDDNVDDRLFVQGWLRIFLN